MGDGIMALFGAPLALEDHAVRACYAALRMQETVKRYAEDVRRADGVAIQIRVGLNAGEVVVRSIGSDLKMDYSAVGQTTNLAARMEQLATPGSIHQQAGRKAASRSAHREAIAAFEQGLLALQRCPETPETTELSVDLNLDLDFELFLIGEIRRGLEALRRAEADAHALGDQRRLGYISVRTGDRLRILGEYDEAVERLQRALHIADELGSLGLQVMAKFHRALVSYSVGDYREASTILAGNVALLQGDLIGERFGYPTPPGINSLAWLVRSQAELGNFAEAMRIGKDGLQIAERTESPWSIAQTCLAIGGALAIRGTLAEAIALLDRGLALCESREFYLPAAMTASYLAYAYALSGRLSNISPLLARATELALRPEFRSGQPRLLVTLGEVHLLAGQAADAARLAERTLAQSRQHRHRADEALALRLLAEIAARREPPDVIEAEARYREGLALAEELENRPVAGHCHLGLGKLYGRAGKPHQAREHLTTAATMYREMDMRFWLEKTEAELRALD